jgi:hypothetical protein
MVISGSDTCCRYTIIFTLNDLYTHEDIYRSLGVGNAGGIRMSTDDTGQIKRAVLLTSVPTARIRSENPYHDRIEGNVLVYTGAGQEGDQVLGGRNKRLLEQASIPFPIYCFQLLGSRRNKDIGVKRWRFIGLLNYIRHYKETQIDVRDSPREVCVFEFLVLTGFECISPDYDLKLMTELVAESKRLQESSDDERELGKPASINDGVLQQADPVQIERVRSRMLALSPEDFEHLVKDVLVCTGFSNVHVTRYSQDGGIDIIAHAGHTMWPIQSLMIQIQAKRWLHTVGRKEVAELRGSLQPHARGAVVTTSQFSKAAVGEAADAGKQPIVLVDGYDFAQIVTVSKVMTP